MESVKEGIGLGIVVSVATLTVLVLSGSEGSVIVAMGVGVFAGLLFTTLIQVEKLKNVNTAQQTQIDDLKRELEEMKGKMKE